MTWNTAFLPVLVLLKENCSEILFTIDEPMF